MSARIVPTATPETRFYWEKAGEGELWLRQCNRCDRAYFYPRDHCPFCATDDVSWVQASGRARLASYVINHRPEPGYQGAVPYVIALVDLAEGPRMLTNVVEVEAEPHRLPVGLQLEVVFERRGGVGVPQFQAPYGVASPPTVFTLPALAYMDRYGVTEDQLASVAVAQRQWAERNPRAYRRDPITVQDVLASRVIAWPFHIHECCVVTDGGGALVVASEERAADMDLAHPVVRVLGTGESCEGPGPAFMEDLTSFRAFRDSSRDALDEAGLTTDDIDHLMVYDAFAHVPLYGLEDIGFVDRGEAGKFVASGATAPGGTLPMNTNGGGLSYTHTGMYGMFAIQVAVRQLRGDAAAQVEGVRTSFVQGIGGMFAAAGALVLGR